MTLNLMSPRYIQEIIEDSAHLSTDTIVDGFGRSSVVITTDLLEEYRARKVTRTKVKSEEALRVDTILESLPLRRLDDGIIPTEKEQGDFIRSLISKSKEEFKGKMKKAKKAGAVVEGDDERSGGRKLNRMCTSVIRIRHSS
jgi:hypothetical protein